MTSPRIASTFARLHDQEEGAFIPFLMLGDPTPDISTQLLEQLIASGADMLELGLPFSDPPGDGPVIQAAGQRALAAGMTTAQALRIIQHIRTRHQLPISLLCYHNVVLQYGIDNFYRDASAAGVDAVLIADLPLEESPPSVPSPRQHGVSPVCMVSELTSDARLAQIAQSAAGYIYVVARVGVTGEQSSLTTELRQVLSRCRQHTSLPLLVGFGISTPAHVRQALEAGADGVIAGSAVVRRVAQTLTDVTACLSQVQAFTQAMKQATTRATPQARRSEDHLVEKGVAEP